MAVLQSFTVPAPSPSVNRLTSSLTLFEVLASSMNILVAVAWETSLFLLLLLLPFTSVSSSIMSFPFKHSVWRWGSMRSLC